jgi:sugar phosphate isomerase/epimerase
MVSFERLDLARALLASLGMTRRDLLALAAAGATAPFLAASEPVPFAMLGIDLFSLRSQNWTPFQYLDYCAAQKAKVVHFSEVRFMGGLEPANLRKVRRHAEELNIELEIGMKSICPSSAMFDAKAGTAEEQLAVMIEAAQIVGSKIVRCVLGSADDRKPGPLDMHIQNTVKVLHKVRSRAMDAGIKIAVENHAGDMQAPEVKMLI